MGAEILRGALFWQVADGAEEDEGVEGFEGAIGADWAKQGKAWGLI